MVERRLERACVRIRLELLGGFGARDEAGRELAIGSRKAQALLAFLGLSPGNPQSREKLTNLLWSDRGDAQARSSLRQALSELRRALPESAPPILRAQRDAVWLEPGAVEVDVVTLENLIDGAEPEALSEAVALYRGDFLDGLEVRDAAFEEWRRGERERLRERTSQALVRLLDHQTGEQAIATARRLLALDPLNEATHRRLMRLYADAGDRNMALRQYQACREVLLAELEVEQDAATQKLAKEIGRAEIGNGTSKNEMPLAELTRERGSTRLLPDNPSVAVLPFTNMSGDPEQEYFADGITEDIITELSRFHSLFVIARNSTFHYKGQSPKVQDVGHELAVRYVVEGSVRKAGNRVRITVQLVEAANNNHIWAERYDRDLEDIFAVQDEVTRTIVSTIAGRIESVGHERATPYERR